MIVSTSAPLRVDFTGGYTDLPLIYENLGGVALNVAIDYRTRVFLTESGAGPHCDGMARSLYHASSQSTKFVQRLLFHVHKILGRDEPRVVVVHTDGPKGCGLGSSASLAVAVVALTAPDLPESEIVEVARHAEVDAGNECGMQDEVAATYGGLNSLEFPGAGLYSPPTINSTQACVIERYCSLWLAEAHRSSGGLVEQVLASFRVGDRSIYAGLRRLNDAYPRLRTALLGAEIHELIESVREVHMAQVSLQEGIVPRSTQRLVATIEERFGGAAKLQGGGGPGAALLVLLPVGPQPELECLMATYGYRSLRLKIESTGILKYEDHLLVGARGGVARSD